MGYDWITPLAAAIAASFTGAIFYINSRQLRHARQVDRAYVSGGGPGNSPDGPFVLTINNYGKTPATLVEYAVEFCEKGKIPSTPVYLDSGYRRIRWRGIYKPEEHAKPINVFPYKELGLREPIVYGRFWYEDVWRKSHYSSFILSLRADPLPEGINLEYSAWT